MTDTATLLEQARQGAAAAFCLSAAAHEARLYRQAVSLCDSLHTAEDLVAEAMVEAWRSLTRFDGSCRFSTWLYAILLHRHQKLRRRNRSRPVPLAALPGDQAQAGESLLAQLPDPRPSAYDDTARNELAARLRQAVAGLPEAQQAVILLRFYEDASLLEIAAALRLPLGTVKSRLHHALTRLRQMQMVMNLSGTGGDTCM
jgi:RNA polymerase sigma-70 factor, ECF subfamily